MINTGVRYVHHLCVSGIQYILQNIATLQYFTFITSLKWSCNKYYDIFLKAISEKL